MVRAMARYVHEYQDQLTMVLADERSVQQIRYHGGVGLRTPMARVMDSEMFFAFLPTTHEWMAFRDVATVDGQPLADRPDLKTMLETLPASTVEHALKAANARFNLGRAVRNYTEPTLSLLVFEPTWLENFVFTVKRVEQAGDATLVTLSFHEHGPLTLIIDLDGSAAPSEGELTAEAGTGRIHRAVLTTQLGMMSSMLTTVYGPDAKLGMWVPSEFREVYRTTTSRSADLGEDVSCEAKYVNYRRFEVHGGIKGGGEPVPGRSRPTLVRR
jgi:hypothetical protein